MKTSILFFILLLQNLLLGSPIKAAYAIGIFDEKGNGENIQHVRHTKANYDGTCFTKVFVVGKTLQNNNVEVKIGNALGHYQSSKPIFNTQNIKIGEVLTFKHYGVTNGLIVVSKQNKIFDTKVFVK